MGSPWGGRVRATACSRTRRAACLCRATCPAATPACSGLAYFSAPFPNGRTTLTASRCSARSLPNTVSRPSIVRAMASLGHPTAVGITSRVPVDEATAVLQVPRSTPIKVAFAFISRLPLDVTQRFLKPDVLLEHFAQEGQFLLAERLLPGQ